MGVQLPIQNFFVPKPTPTDWVRPSDWITITDTPDEVEFLVADIDLANFTIRTQFTRTTGNINIDWGDGSPITIVSTTAVTNTSKQYTIGTGTPCSRGYTTFKIRVWGDATCVITYCQPVAPIITGGALGYNMGLLEAVYGDGTVNLIPFNYGGVTSAAPILGGFGYLEYVKCPHTVNWVSGLTFMFSQNTSIQKIIMPVSLPQATNFRHMFSGCVNLRGEINLPLDAILITSGLEATFQNCRMLSKITLPLVLECQLTLTFNGCSSLKNMTIPDIPVTTNLLSMFSGCVSLQWVKFSNLPTPASPNTTIDFTNLFQGCSTLENVYFPASCSANARYSCTSLFNGCVNLKSIIFPINFDALTIGGAFSNCNSIQRIIFPNGFTNCSSMSIAFSGCSNLVSINLPPTVGVPVTLNNLFAGCTSLETAVIPDTYVITGSMSVAFLNCSSLKSIVLPNNDQDNIISVLSTFLGCGKLETLTLPTSMNGVTDITSLFNGCVMLSSVTLPSLMNSVTTMNSTFNGCVNLKSVTLPTSMTSCVIFTNTFTNCVCLPTIDMPTTVGSVTTWANAFRNCTSLKTLTLPANQQSAVNSILSFIQNCGALTTINNLDKIGSLGAAPLVDGRNNTGINIKTSLSFSCPLTGLLLNGVSATNFTLLNSLRLLNTSSGQWTAPSPQINVGSTLLSTAALVTLFNDMAAQGNVVSKTINIGSATGAAGLTAGNRAIITSIGWTITG